MNSLSDPESKILRHVDRLADFNRGLAYPISAEIDLTWRCSLNCKGCHSKHLHSNIELQPDQIKRILTELHSHGLQAVTWSGGGDPLESPFAFYAFELAHDLRLDQALYSYLPNIDSDFWEDRQEVFDYLGSRMRFVYTHSCNTKGLKRNSKTVWTYGHLLDETNYLRISDLIKQTNLDFFNFVDFRPLAPENKPDASKLNYEWVPMALHLLKEHARQNPQVKFAEYKFTDLMRPNFGRDYHKCFSTDFTCSIGPNGDMYECLNRRGFSDSILGNLLTESLEEIWKRKARYREDLSQCRILCRNHEMNKTLYHRVFGPEPEHSNFV